MNPLPPNADELVSAYLDDEATPDEITIVESNPELMGRVESMRALSDRLGASVPVAPAQKEAHIAAALGAFDDLFAPESTEAAPLDAVAPILASVPDSVATDRSVADAATTVTSFEAARDRRRPRRFNTGVIAAAAAALLLFVAVAALSFGRGGESNEVAVTAADRAVDASSASGDDEAMDDTEAAFETESALSDLDDTEDAARAAPQAAEDDGDSTSAPTAEEEATDDAVAMDEAEEEPDADVADEAMDDAAGGVDSAAESAEIRPVPPIDLSLGDFADEEALRLELGKSTAEDFIERSRFLEPGLFPGCQLSIPELADLDSTTLVGEAFVDNRLVEVHLVSTDDDGISLIIVDPSNGCSIVSTVP